MPVDLSAESLRINVRDIPIAIYRRVCEAAFANGVIPRLDGSGSDTIRWALAQFVKTLDKNDALTATQARPEPLPEQAESA